MRRLAWLLPLVLGCGSDPPVDTPTACEMAGACQGQNECGGGAANFKEVVFCTNCPYRNDTHVCQACACEALPAGQGGNLVSFLSVPAKATGAQSFTLSAFFPTMADGSKLTCARLLQGDTAFLVNNPKLASGNSTFKQIAGGADPTLSYQVQLYDSPGEDHLFFVQVTSEGQGKGTVMAKGCAEGVDVPNSGNVNVTVTLQ